VSFLAFSTTDLGFHIQQIRIDGFYPWDGPFPASSSSQSSTAQTADALIPQSWFSKRNFSSPFTQAIWLDFYSQPSADFKMLISLKCDYVLRNALREKASCKYSCITSYPRNSASSGKEKRTQSSEFLFLFRKVDENAPNVSQIMPFLVGWLVNIAYCRSSFSDAHKLVRDEVFIKSYIPPDTQYSSPQLRRKAIHWRDGKSTRMMLRSLVLRSESSYKWVTPRAGASKEVRLVEYVEISPVNEVLVWSGRVQWRAALGGHRLSALRWWHQESSNTYWCSPQPKVSLFWLSSLASSWMRKSQWSYNLFPSYEWLVECNNPERYRLYDDGGVRAFGQVCIKPVWRTHVRVWLCIAWVLSVSVWCAASSCLAQKGHDCHLPTLRPLSRRTWAKRKKETWCVRAGMSFSNRRS